MAASGQTLLALDIGTSAVKLGMYGDDLQSLGSLKADLAVGYPRPGWVEQDPTALLTVVTDLLGGALDRVRSRGEAILGIDHQGESVVAWDVVSKEPLSPIISWQCKRSANVLADIVHAGKKAEVESLSRLPLSEYFSAGKISWLLRTEPAVADALSRGRLAVGPLDAYVTHSLGGDYATDNSTASRTQLFDFESSRWSAELCDLFAVPQEVLPAIVDTCEETAPISIKPHVTLRLAARACDQQAALFGSGCTRRGDVKVTAGTGAFLLSLEGFAPPQPRQGAIPTVAWSCGGRVRYAVEGGVLSAGSMFEWFRRLGLGQTADELVALGDSVRDANGIAVLPALDGLGSPYWDSSTRVVIAGASAGSKPEHLARATLESIAHRIADVVERVHDQNGRDYHLRLDGGLSHSTALPHLLAETCGTAIGVGTHDCTSLGTAAFAAIGGGAMKYGEAESVVRGQPWHLRLPSANGEGMLLDRRSWQKFVAACRAFFPIQVDGPM